MAQGLVRGHSRAVLERILEEPQLVAAVQSLQPRVLLKLIEHVGLEDCGELLALASAEQLTAVFDEDLWSSAQPGSDESFDLERFGLWLEILVDQGAELAARKLLELDADLLTLALCRLVLVVDNDELTEAIFATRGEEHDLVDKALESSLCHELDEYLVVCRTGRHWDAVLAVLVELHADKHEILRGLLTRCAAISSEYIEDNGGLYDVLTTEQMIESDLAAERELRRERLGYVAPSDAMGFLRLACGTSLTQLLEAPALDPLTHAHLRAAPLYRRAAPQASRSLGRNTSAQSEGAQSIDTNVDLMALLHEAGVLSPDAAPRLLTRGAARTNTPLLAEVLSAFAASEPAVHAQRMQELAYAANVLLAALGTKQDPLRPVDAAQAALLLCERGATYALRGARTTRMRKARLEELLRTRDLVRLFQVGSHLLCLRHQPGGPGAALLEPLRARLRALGLGRGGANSHSVTEKGSSSQGKRTRSGPPGDPKSM